MYKLLTLAALFLVLTSQALAYGKVFETTFYSEALGQEKSVQIYLPGAYDSPSCRRYPVIYFFHGALDGFSGYGILPGILDYLIENRVIRPVIMVKPDGFSSPYPASFYTSSDLYGDLEGYLADDLVEWVDDNFRTIPSRRKRVVMGHSMGGYGALVYYGQFSDTYMAAASVCGSGLDLPTMIEYNLAGVLAELPGMPYQYNPSAGFANLVLFSMSGAFSDNMEKPPFYVDLPLDGWANIIPEVWDRWMEHNPPHLMADLVPNSSGTNIYFDIGTRDEFHGMPACDAFAESLKVMGLEFEYQVFAGGHFDKLWQRFPIAIEFLCEAMHHTWPWGYEEQSTTNFAESITSIGFHQASPSRFSDLTTITFDLHIPGYVSLDIYDGMGRIIETLIDCDLNTGMHDAVFNGSDLASGVYFYCVRSGGENATGKLLLIR
ncbi:MAG: hypothetical protein KAR40_01730 [Candidatus Sabulitectum sp.]|nr:hypothetical protein [Candidatus Sabulitectum sp.]